MKEFGWTICRVVCKSGLLVTGIIVVSAIDKAIGMDYKSIDQGVIVAHKVAYMLLGVLLWNTMNWGGKR